jgi:signal transduction histidine kinase
MLQEAFQHRSGRVISLARLLLATVFLGAIYADPSQPSRWPAAAYGVLAAYFAFAAFYLTLTWTNWWLENRLARPAHWLDVTLFGLMVYLTEGYTSPFFTFSVFVILAATIKWGWRETATTAVAIILLFFVAGLGGTDWNANVEVTRIAIRGTHLIVLSLVLIWFAVNQPARFLRRRIRPEPADSSEGPPVRAGLEFVAQRTGARRVALLWWDKDEPWMNLATLGDLSADGRFPPDRFEDLVDSRLAGRTFIFDAGRRRVLVGRDSSIRGLDGVAHPLGPELAKLVGADSGLVVPVDSDRYEGLFVATEVPGLCADDLAIGRTIAEDFSAVLQSASLRSMSAEAAASRTRLALARDLHDSVVQLLAGTSLRLAGIRTGIGAGRAVEKDLELLQEQLGTEQRELRKMIDGLREGAGASDEVRLSESVGLTLSRAAVQWQVECELAHCPSGLVATPGLEHEVSHLVREAVANAVKHGNASRVSVAVDSGDGGLSLVVEDNGSGFPVDGKRGPGEHLAPWSLNERVHELGGTLMLASTDRGSQITIVLPWERPE